MGHKAPTDNELRALATKFPFCFHDFQNVGIAHGMDADTLCGVAGYAVTNSVDLYVAADEFRITEHETGREIKNEITMDDIRQVAKDGLVSRPPATHLILGNAEIDLLIGRMTVGSAAQGNGGLHFHSLPVVAAGVPSFLKAVHIPDCNGSKSNEDLLVELARSFGSPGQGSRSRTEDIRMDAAIYEAVMRGCVILQSRKREAILK